MPNTTRQTHTPGPWFVEKATDGTLWVTLGSTPRYIAKCGLATVDGNPANARLIAHAPAMVALVRRIADRYEVEQRLRPDALVNGISHEDGQTARAILRAVEG
jgi:hypothetical protein